MDDETIKRYQHLIRAAVNGAYDEEAQEFYTTAMIHIYGEVKQRSGYELCPNGTDYIFIHQHGELLGGYTFKEETAAMYDILVQLNPNRKKSVQEFIDKATTALLEIIKKNV